MRTRIGPEDVARMAVPMQALTNIQRLELIPRESEWRYEDAANIPLRED